MPARDDALSRRAPNDDSAAFSRERMRDSAGVARAFFRGRDRDRGEDRSGTRASAAAIIAKTRERKRRPSRATSSSNLFRRQSAANLLGADPATLSLSLSLARTCARNPGTARVSASVRTLRA
jgi:hypothetical protein